MTLNVRAEVFLVFLLLVASPVGSAQQIGSLTATSYSAIDQQRRSFFEQRASLKRQMGDAGFAAALATTFYGTVRPVNTLNTPTCAALEIDKREDLITAAARKEAIGPNLIRAVMHRESGFRPCAVSAKGALGLMQLMPATLAEFHVSNPFDPAQSVHAGAALLRNLLDKYEGDLTLTLAAYNAGVSRIDNTDPGDYPAETKNYIAEILTEVGVRSSVSEKPIE
jgi:soluble lytic murein transglycosylase-like protein